MSHCVRLFFIALSFCSLFVFNRLFLHMSIFVVFVYLSHALSASRNSPRFPSFSVSVSLSACLSAIVCVCHSLFVSLSFSVPVRLFPSLSVSVLYISLSIGNFMSPFNTLLLNSCSVSFCLSPFLSFSVLLCPVRLSKEILRTI
jgi:hypothetical protein